MRKSELRSDLKLISEARHHDPFSVLGRHEEGGQTVVRAFIPRAAEVVIAEGSKEMARVGDSDHFEWRGNGGKLPRHYSLIWRD